MAFCGRAGRGQGRRGRGRSGGGGEGAEEMGVRETGSWDEMGLGEASTLEKQNGSGHCFLRPQFLVLGSKLLRFKMFTLFSLYRFCLRNYNKNFKKNLG